MCVLLLINSGDRAYRQYIHHLHNFQEDHIMARGFNWFNDAYEPDVFDTDPTAGMSEAEMEAYFNQQEEKARLDAELRSIVNGAYV